MQDSPEEKGSDNPDEEVEKEVVLTAYLDERYQDEDDHRKVADSFDSSRDYYEQSTRTTERKYLVVGNGDDAPRIEIDDDTEVSVLRKMVNDDIDGPVKIETETEEDTSYRNSPGYRPAGWVHENVVDELPEDVTVDGRPVSKANGWGDDSWQDTAGETVLRVSKSKLKRRRMLRHRSERSSDDRYDGPEEFWSVQLTVSLGPASEAAINSLSDSFVGELSTILARHDGISTVRVSSCKVTKTGDCYDV